ncbi:MAG TPA: M1 family metallopeptidase [Candidatus Bipolaricaulota bacterium]
MKRTHLLAMWMIIATYSCAAFGLPNEVSYHIEAKLDTTFNFILGAEQVTITNHTGTPLPELYFHLPPNAFKRGADTSYQRDLKAFYNVGLDWIYADPADDAFLLVDAVTLDGQALAFTSEDTFLKVTLPAPLEAEGTLTLSITFLNDLMVPAPVNLFAASYAVRSGVRNGVYTVGKWYPQLAVYDQAGWHLDPYRLLGEFYGDFGDYALKLTVPGDVVVGATGDLVSLQDNADGTRTWAFATQRAHDVAWVASARYRVSEVEWEGKRVRTLWLNQEGLAALALDSFQFYSRTFGAYAYGTFSIAQVEVGGGMEYPGIVMIAKAVVEEVSHEVAHQWWYGAVGNDEYNETWLDEGPTTFSSELYRIEARGEPSTLRRMLTYVETGPPVLTPSDQFTSLRAFGNVIYTKGSSIFWMLRGLLGHDLFLQALRAYYERYRYRNATTADLIGVFEEEAAQPLDWFFEQWLHTSRVLDVTVQDVQSQVQPDGSSTVSFTLANQGQARMPVRVQLLAEQQIVSEFVWDGKQPLARFTVASESTLTRIVLDPEQSLLESDRNDNAWAISAMSAWSTVGFAVALALAGGVWWRLTARGA